MWDNYRALNILANGLFISVVLVTIVAITPHIINLPVFALKNISIVGKNSNGKEFKYITRKQISNIINRNEFGNFFTVELDMIGSEFEKLPWVRTANIRRNWPNSIEIELEEHIVLARRDGSELVNTYGEVFLAKTNRKLTELKFTGLAESSQKVSQNYLVFNKLLKLIQRSIVQLDFSARQAWRIHLEDGAILELGRENMVDRLATYVAVHEQVVSQFREKIIYIDLRYPNGFAVRTVNSTHKKHHNQIIKTSG
tara:strand:+ start:21605 stop:22369 length:765 start_codon:yes stop_codon:yes gene_type:complete